MVGSEVGVGVGVGVGVRMGVGGSAVVGAVLEGGEGGWVGRDWESVLAWAPKGEEEGGTVRPPKPMALLRSFDTFHCCNCKAVRTLNHAMITANRNEEVLSILVPACVSFLRVPAVPLATTISRFHLLLPLIGCHGGEIVVKYKNRKQSKMKIEQESITRMNMESDRGSERITI